MTAEHAWINHEPLATVVRRLDSMARSGALDPEAFALLARRLVAHEAAPGGPYADDNGKLTRAVNEPIARLMDTIGVSLPGLERFLRRPSPAQLANRAGPTRLTLAQRRARTAFNGLREPLRSNAGMAYDQIVALDHAGEMSRLSEAFAESLGHRAVTILADGLAEDLGVANLLVWTAYSLYDDVADQEGPPSVLPVANAAHRAAVSAFDDAVPMGKPLTLSTFDGMDEAYAWELAYCRFKVDDDTITIGPIPAYGRLKVLAGRAGAHVLGPRLIARMSGLTSDQRSVIDSALDDYLIARQLSDDLHDWTKDLARGQISPIVGRLLLEADVEPGTYPLDGLTERLRTVFWNGELVRSSRLTLAVIDRARQKLARAHVMSARSPFIELTLNPIERSLLDGLARHVADRRFLSTYRSFERNRPK